MKNTIFRRELLNDHFMYRLKRLRNDLVALNFWTEDSVDQDVIPTISNIDELEEYEYILRQEV